MTNQIISLKNITKNFGRKKALNNLSWELDKDQKWALIGPNGAGKTTLIAIIAKYLKHEGSYQTQMDQSMIGVLAQDTAIWNNIKVSTFIEFVAKLNPESHDKLNSLKTIFAIKEIEKSLFKNLSFGQKKRVLLIAALTGKKFTLLDEPLTGLDPSSSMALKKFLKEETDLSWIVSSHQLRDLEDICTHILVLEKGEIKFCGPKEQFTESGNIIRVKTAELLKTHKDSPFEYDIDGKSALFHIKDVESNQAMSEILKWANLNGYEILEIAKGMGLEESYLKKHDETEEKI